MAIGRPFGDANGLASHETRAWNAVRDVTNSLTDRAMLDASAMPLEAIIADT